MVRRYKAGGTVKLGAAGAKKKKLEEKTDFPIGKLIDDVTSVLSPDAPKVQDLVGGSPQATTLPAGEFAGDPKAAEALAKLGNAAPAALQGIAGGAGGASGLAGLLGSQGGAGGASGLAGGPWGAVAMAGGKVAWDIGKYLWQEHQRKKALRLEERTYDQMLGDASIDAVNREESQTDMEEAMRRQDLAGAMNGGVHNTQMLANGGYIPRYDSGTHPVRGGLQLAGGIGLAGGSVAGALSPLYSEKVRNKLKTMPFWQGALASTGLGLAAGGGGALIGSGLYDLTEHSPLEQQSNDDGMRPGEVDTPTDSEEAREAYNAMREKQWEDYKAWRTRTEGAPPADYMKPMILNAFGLGEWQSPSKSDYSDSASAEANGGYVPRAVFGWSKKEWENSSKPFLEQISGEGYNNAFPWLIGGTGATGLGAFTAFGPMPNKWKGSLPLNIARKAVGGALGLSGIASAGWGVDDIFKGLAAKRALADFDERQRDQRAQQLRKKQENGTAVEGAWDFQGMADWEDGMDPAVVAYMKEAQQNVDTTHQPGYANRPDLSAYAPFMPGQKVTLQGGDNIYRGPGANEVNLRVNKDAYGGAVSRFDDGGEVDPTNPYSAILKKRMPPFMPPEDALQGLSDQELSAMDAGGAVRRYNMNKFLYGGQAPRYLFGGSRDKNEQGAISAGSQKGNEFGSGRFDPNTWAPKKGGNWYQPSAGAQQHINDPHLGYNQTSNNYYSHPNLSGGSWGPLDLIRSYKMSNFRNGPAGYVMGNMMPFLLSTGMPLVGNTLNTIEGIGSGNAFQTVMGINPLVAQLGNYATGSSVWDPSFNKFKDTFKGNLNQWTVPGIWQKRTGDIYSDMWNSYRALGLAAPLLMR